MTPSNGKPPSHIERARQLLDYAETADEISEVTENHVTVNLVDQTGKFRAMETPTQPDNPRPQQESIPEQAVEATTKLVTVGGQNWRNVIVVCVLAALAAFAAWLRWGH